MYFAKSLLVGASCLIALSQAAKLGFTKTPATVKAGESTTIEWTGGDNSAVTITLKSGDPRNLKTVQIITGDATGTSFTWKIPANLPSGEDYALQINQGQADVNYSGQFSLSGGAAVVSSVSSLASSRTAVLVSSVSSASRTSASAASVTSAASASVSSLVSSLLSALSTPSKTAVVVTTIIPHNVTTVLVGTGALASGTGTGTPLPRNTTLSHATLSNTKTVTTSIAVTTTAAGTAAGTSGGSDSNASASPVPGNSATGLASPLAFVISAFVAIMYLG